MCANWLINIIVQTVAVSSLDLLDLYFTRLVMSWLVCYVPSDLVVLVGHENRMTRLQLAKYLILFWKKVLWTEKSQIHLYQ